MKIASKNLRLLALMGYLLFYSLPSQATTIAVTCPGQSLQAAVDGAQPGDTISVTGTCNENILIRNEKQRLAIQHAVPGATVNGPDTTLPTINVRGKGILIRQMNISGGRSGVHVNRGSNAVIDANNIDSNIRGILVDQQSFAVITNNIISGNDVGIDADESSTVRIGYNLETDTSAGPNIITFNSTGIVIRGNSNAKIAGNAIVANVVNGIHVTEQSHAVIGGNNIGSNGDDGIELTFNSSADLGVSPTGPTFLGTLNNSNGGNNGGHGIKCDIGGYIRGSEGALSGNAGARVAISGCLSII